MIKGSLRWEIRSGVRERGDKGLPCRYEDHFCQSFRSEIRGVTVPSACLCPASWDEQLLGASPAQQRGSRLLPAPRTQRSQCCGAEGMISGESCFSVLAGGERDVGDGRDKLAAAPSCPPSLPAASGASLQCL